ncbi:SCP2 sterol-binding domain-containing protein [Euzebya sp.]|uniref:SCP2 sterol-binding domain-containing protein n=1 Tax=Euzebya sp. TaxID=1971409 RepID=UPI003514269A
MSEHPFPSIEWMEAYADAVAAHPDAEALSRGLEGRYRFTITSGGGFEGPASYDLVVAPPSTFAAEEATGDAADLAVTADYPRWRGLLTGRADFVMSFLMRKIKIDGDLSAVRSRLQDAKPLLDCLKQVPTRYPH